MMEFDPRQPSEALGRALDAWRTSRARPEFKDGLRVRFVSLHGRPNQAASAALDAYAPRARVQFREQLAQGFLAGFEQHSEGGVEQALDAFEPAARPGFKDELRARFVEALDELEPIAEAPSRAPAPTARATRPVRRRQAPAPPGRSKALPEEARGARRRFQLIAGGAVGSIAVAAALVLWFLNPAALPTERPDFVIDGESYVVDGVQVDGQPLPADMTAEQLGARLAGARSITSGEQPLRILFRDQFVVELGAGSYLDLSGLSGDGDAWVLASDERPGVYRVATTDSFDGEQRPLQFHTPSRHLEVVGTTFGVDVFDRDTICICCCEGEVRTYAPDDELHSDPVHEHGTLFTDAAGASRKQGFEAHQKPLRELRAFLDAWPAAQPGP